MSDNDDELIGKAKKILKRLCERGILRMSIPVRLDDDEDMVLSRIIDRAADKGLTDPERVELNRLRALINSPQTEDYTSAVVMEAAHQQERWGSEHDTGKSSEDWIFLIGFLLGKGAQAFKSGDTKKGLHHIISSGAAGLNWHRQVTGLGSGVRPGIDPAARGVTELPPNES